MADEQSTSLSPSPIPPNTYLPVLFSGAPNAAPGTPLCALVSTDSRVAEAKADSGDTTYVVGLAAKVGVAGHPVHCQYGGPLTLTEAEWDVVAGTTGGLDHGAPYYLSAATLGKITATPPGAGFLAPIGIALSTTTLLIQLSLATAISP